MAEIRNPKTVAAGGRAACPPTACGLRNLDFGHWTLDSIHNRSTRAFTLIEMLLAVAICAIVLVAINGVFATAVRLRDKTSEVVDEALPVTRALDIMHRDLQGTVGPGGFLAGDFKCGAQAMGARMGLSGEAGNAGLDFCTSTGAISDKAPWGDIQEVFYELKAPTDRNETGMDLVRCINRNLLATTTQTPEIQWLMGKVQTLQFDCYDGTQWRNTWDTSSGDTNLPVAVRIRIQLVAKQGEAARNQQPLEMLVPLGTQTITNLTTIGAK
jgi:type II secretion system protein J